MYLAEADLAPEQELNEIVWKSVKGPHSVMPPPVRAAFIRSLVGAGDDDDDDDDEAPRAAPAAKGGTTGRF
jgi:hypothetical protein